MRKVCLASSTLLILTALAVATYPARAQNERDQSQLRTVHGSVLDRNDNPLSNAVVYLRNKRTDAVRTYISDSGGHFRFAGLDSNADFEIQAEYKHQKSSRHTISSFDSRRDIVINLVINTKK